MYKINSQGTIDNTETGVSGIHPGVWMWEEYQIWLDAGNTPEPYVDPETTPEAIISTLNTMVQTYLDNVVKTRDYDNITTLCSYATSTNPTFQTEAIAGVAWRDAVWIYVNQIKTDILAETRTLPTESELITELPTIDW